MIKNIVIVIIILGVGTFIYMKKDTGEMKNAEMLRGEGASVVSEEVVYFDDVKGFYVRPEAEGVYPGVVMIHENRGLRPEIRDTAKQLAGQGYQVLAVSLLDGVVETQEEAQALTAKFNQATGTANMRAATPYL